jgi:L-aspartate oxidase
MLDKESLINHFPNIYQKCLILNIDISKDKIPVVPAAHYLCGGIKVNKNGRTSIRKLYAAGETVSTGLHGANRLASNSLLEAVAYANKASEHSLKKIEKITLRHSIPDWSDEGVTPVEELVLITQEFKEMQQIMSNYVGIVRSDLRLERAMTRLNTIYYETKDLYDKSKISRAICELRNAVTNSYLVIKMAKRRKESRGLNYNIDYPNKLNLL